MQHMQHILFDLDGTLTDPKIGITKSVQFALRAFGIHADDPDTLRPFIGPPLSESFQKFYGFDEAGAQDAIRKYREYFSVTGIYENSLYNGIPKLLDALRQQGKTLILATSKPTVYAQQILEHFGLAHYFSFVSGSELDGTRVKKAEVITHALANCGIKNIAAAVMVGDREHDVLGAKATGLASIGVLYGYGDRDELQQAGADVLVQTVAELGEQLRR